MSVVILPMVCIIKVSTTYQSDDLASFDVLSYKGSSVTTLASNLCQTFLDLVFGSVLGIEIKGSYNFPTTTFDRLIGEAAFELFFGSQNKPRCLDTSKMLRTVLNFSQDVDFFSIITLFGRNHALLLHQIKNVVLAPDQGIFVKISFVIRGIKSR